MPTPSDTLLIAIFGAGGLGITAMAYRDARLRYRLYYLRWKGDQGTKARDWGRARRWYEAALVGDDGLKGTPTERRLRLITEYSLARVNAYDKRYPEASAQLDAIEAVYTTASDAWARAYIAFLRSLIAQGLGDAASARRFRQTAISHFKELRASPELAYLQQYTDYDRQIAAWEAANGELELLRGLITDRRPSEALRRAHEALRSPALTGLARSYAEGIAGYAERTFGNFDEADRHFASELLESGGPEHLPHQAALVMHRAANATFAADREATERFRRLATQMAASEDARSRGYALGERFTVDYCWGDLSAARQTLAECKALQDSPLDPQSGNALRRIFALCRFCLLTDRLTSADEIADAAQLAADARLSDYLESCDRLYLDAYALKILALQGKRDAFDAALSALESDIERHLADREPADAAALRSEYGVIIDACLAAHAFDAAARFLDRYRALPAYPITAPHVAVWEGHLHLAQGNRTAARDSFSAAIATGLGNDAVSEAREQLVSLDIL